MAYQNYDLRLLVKTNTEDKMVARTLRILRISIPGHRTCSYCGEGHLHRSGQRSLWDSMLQATLGLRPYRCANWDGRHYGFASSRSLSILRHVEHRRDIGCLKPMFNESGRTIPFPISDRASLYRPRCGVELSLPRDALPSAEGAVLAASLSKISEGDCCCVSACPTIVMRFPLLIADFYDQLIQPLHGSTQSQDRARRAGSNGPPWKQLCVSLGKTGAPRTYVPSSAKEMSYSPKARPRECHRNLQWRQLGLRFEEAPRPGLRSHQKTSAASTRPQQWAAALKVTSPMGRSYALPPRSSYRSAGKR